MQSVSSRIWTHVAVSIFYNNNHYTTPTQGGPGSDVKEGVHCIPEFQDWSLTIGLFTVISRTLVSREEGLTPLQRCSWYILQPQSTGRKKIHFFLKTKKNFFLNTIFYFHCRFGQLFLWSDLQILLILQIVLWQIKKYENNCLDFRLGFLKKIYCYELLLDMDTSVLADQQGLTYISSVWTLDPLWRTCQKQ